MSRPQKAAIVLIIMILTAYQLTPYSPTPFQVNGTKSFDEWKETDHTLSYDLLKQVGQPYPQFIICTEIDLLAQHPLSWLLIPHTPTTWKVERILQQVNLHKKWVYNQLPLKNKDLSEAVPFNDAPQKNEKGGDPFCSAEVIEKQRIMEGTHVEVLYNYAPITPLHFLIVPKYHRKNFMELTRDEYLEAIQLAQKLVKSQQEGQKKAYLFHRQGWDTGLSVEHWHMHVVLTPKDRSEWKIMVEVMKKMTIGAQPLSNEELQKRIASAKSLLFKN